MNLLGQFLRNGFNQSLPFMGEPIRINGVDHQGFISSIDSSLEMTLSGDKIPATFTAVIDKAQFQVRPREADQVLFRGAKFEISAVSEDVSAFSITFQLVSRIVSPGGVSGGGLGGTVLGDANPGN